MVSNLIAMKFDKLYTVLYEEQRADQKSKCFDLISSLKLDELFAICKFLVQFNDITDRLESDSYEKLSMIWPICLQLWDMLQPDVADENPQIIVEDMKEMGLIIYLLESMTFDQPENTKSQQFRIHFLKNPNRSRN